MNFINKHKRGIALVVAFAFFYLIHISAAPLPAAQAPAAPATKTAVSSDTDQPGSVEQPAPAYYQPKKSSPIVGIVIAVVLIGVIAAVLILVVFKTKYDITGNWTLNFHWLGSAANSTTNTYSGTKKAGTFTTGDGGHGTYAVDNKNVSFTFSTGTIYIGTFTSKTTMSGTMVNGSGTMSGTWTATKLGTAATGTSTLQSTSSNGPNSAGDRK